MAWLHCAWWSGGRVGEDDFLAGVEALDLADLGLCLAGGAEGLAGVRADGFLLAALAGDPPVHRAEAGIGLGRGHRGLPEGAAQVPVALAGAAGFRGLP